MKREGRQHGFVRCYVISPTTSSYRRYVKTVHPATVAGYSTKVSGKPTNQSKFTGTCGRARCVDCHIRPVCKSKEKAKGTMKLRSIGSDARLIRYPAGTSATDVLDDLASEEFYDYDYGNDWGSSIGYLLNRRRYRFEIGNGRVSIETEKRIWDEDEDDSMWSEDEDDYMSYRDVGLYWGEGDADEYGDDGWYLVGRIEQFPSLGKNASFIPFSSF